MSRPLDDLAQAVAEALRPNPNWTPEQRRVIAAIMVIQECTFAEAAGALWQEMQKEGSAAAWWAPHILNTWVSSAGYRIQSARRDARQRKPIAVVPSHPNWGPLTNVVRCAFKEDDQRINRYFNEGRLTAEQMGVALVREELRKNRRKGLHDAVDNMPVANDNEPDLTAQPKWHTKVQAAWVTSVASRRVRGKDGHA
jgi:hypothetical protein